MESACDAEVALEQLEHATAAPDILVTDVHMPGASGTELVTKLRARWPRLPVVFMTGYAEVEALRAMPSDAQLLRKPFTTEQAVEALRRAVESMVEGLARSDFVCRLASAKRACRPLFGTAVSRGRAPAVM